VVLAAVAFFAVSASGSAVSAPDADLVAARAAAERILALTPIPLGAVKQTTDQSADGSLARTVPFVGGQLVDRHQYWTLSDSPSSVSAYVGAHPPSGSRHSELETGMPPYFWSEMVTFRDVTGRLTSEILQVSVAAGRGGGTAVRADAEVLWRPSWEQIPASTRAAAVKLDGVAQPVMTVADVARVRDLINADGVAGPGGYSCPAGRSGQDVTVTFLDGRERPVARVSSNSLDGCDFLAISVGGRRGPALWGGASLVQRLWSLGALVRCTAGQLTVSMSRVSDSPAGDSATISVHNRAQTPCSLQGYPSLELLSANGRRLPNAHTRERSPPGVATAPGHIGLSANVFWPAQTRCPKPAAASVIVRIPGIPHPFPVPLRTSRTRFGPCDGQLTISPIGTGP
jgi:hypothetical protein